MKRKITLDYYVLLTTLRLSAKVIICNSILVKAKRLLNAFTSLKNISKNTGECFS